MFNSHGFKLASLHIFNVLWLAVIPLSLQSESYVLLSFFEISIFFFMSVVTITFPVTEDQSQTRSNHGFLIKNSLTDKKKCSSRWVCGFVFVLAIFLPVINLVDGSQLLWRKRTSNFMLWIENNNLSGYLRWGKFPVLNRSKNCLPMEVFILGTNIVAA